MGTLNYSKNKKYAQNAGIHLITLIVIKIHLITLQEYIAGIHLITLIVIKMYSCILAVLFILRTKKQAFFKLNNCRKNFSIACAEQQSFIILNSSNFACKHKKITEILSF